MTRKVTCVLVDDEPLARGVLVRLLSTVEDFEVVGICATGQEAIEVLEREEVDVVFLDLRMPEVDGFEVLRSVDPEHWPLVVFVTAHNDAAIQAFEVGAMDYLLKPFDDERFMLTLDRVRRRISRQDRAELGSQIAALLSAEDASSRTNHREQPLTPASLPDERIPVRVGGRVVFVDVRSIRWIQAEDYYVRLHTASESYLLRESLTRLEGRLDQAEFVRVHRSALVRISGVKELRYRDAGGVCVMLEDGTKVPVSRSRRRHVSQALGVTCDD